MYKKQRYSLGVLVLLMDEMDAQLLVSIYFDLGLELRQFVDLSLLFLPVESIFPVCSQSLHIGERSAIVPASIIQFIRELCHLQLRSEFIEPLVSHGGCEGCY